MQNKHWKHRLWTDMQFSQYAGLKMQCNKLNMHAEDYCAFKKDLYAKIRKQREENAMQQAKMENKT